MVAKNVVNNQKNSSETSSANWTPAATEMICRETAAIKDHPPVKVKAFRALELIPAQTSTPSSIIASSLINNLLHNVQLVLLQTFCQIAGINV